MAVRLPIAILKTRNAWTDLSSVVQTAVRCALGGAFRSADASGPLTGGLVDKGCSLDDHSELWRRPRGGAMGS